MARKKKIKENDKKEPESDLLENKPKVYLFEKIGKAVEGLYYISETDAEIFPFSGRKAEEVTKEEILAQTEHFENPNVEERNFADFFERLIKIQDWFGTEETEIAGKFSELKDLLEQNLRDLKVFKIGSIELDVYVVGLDAENILTGIRTKAVET